MIAINVNISYPGLTSLEEERLRELIRRELQPTLARVCCGMVKDGKHMNGEFVDGDFLLSNKLCIDGTIKIVDGFAEDDRIRVS